MRYPSSVAGVLAAIALCGLTASGSAAAVLYNSDFSQVKSVLAISGTSSTYVSLGDDYNTGAASITLTGLSFYGGVDSSLTRTQVVVTFYDSTGARMQSVYPSISETAGTNTVHTLKASDFNLNGSTTGLTLPGAGYVTFSPVSYSSFNINTGIATPADTNPAMQLGSGVAPTVGTNNGAAAASVDSNGVLSTPAIFSVNGTPANQSQYALFSLSNAAVPEPASLALVLPAALFLKRRRV